VKYTLLEYDAMLVGSVVSAGWELPINAFPPGQVLKEYYRAEAMGVGTGLVSCTAVEKKHQKLFC
jgi:hypothetical protein